MSHQPKYDRGLKALGTLLLLAAAALLPVRAQSQPPALREKLPFDLTDVLDGAKFRMRVPANWNRTLLVYLEGLKSATPPPAPVLTPPVLKGSTPDLEETLLSRGYALAASEVANTDLQHKEEVQDSFALTTYFRGRLGNPSRVIVWGTSAGGFATLRLIEEFPRSFDAAIATCASAGGLPGAFDRFLDFGVAHDAVFGWPANAWGPLEDTRPGLGFATQVSPLVPWPKPDGSNRGAWEFIRLVSHIEPGAFWGTDPMWGATGFMFNVPWATQIRESMEVWAAGPFTQNLGRQYTLTLADKEYLRNLGVNNADELLAKMNARTNIAANPRSRDYMNRFATVRGVLRRPLLTLHTTLDWGATVSNGSVYKAAVEESGCSQNLVQAFVKGTGHCAFTSKQLLAALNAVERWLDTGVPPDKSFFPESEGFDNQFVPAPWPY